MGNKSSVQTETIDIEKQDVDCDGEGLSSQSPKNKYPLYEVLINRPQIFQQPVLLPLYINPTMFTRAYFDKHVK